MSPARVPPPRNVRLFILFRALFNARFYYPVFTILFLDLGLTLAQFAVLNAVWAATIVALEVPLGALADVIGRRKLVVMAAGLMVAEMGLLCAAPRGRPVLLFAVLLVNRIFSGAAEAAASGADEAIAYDSLRREGREEAWPQVLERQMRFQAMAAIAAVIVGAAVYDAAFLQSLALALGWDVRVSAGLTLRLPLVLSLFSALGALGCALGLDEEPLAPGSGGSGIRAAVHGTLGAVRWILATPFALVVIAAGMLFDNCIRMVITLVSQYYRVIHLPEALFGVVGAALAVLGLIVPRLAAVMVRRRSPAANFGIMAVGALLGLSALNLFAPVFGILPVALLFVVMYLNHFFQSHYLNRLSGSHHRATVLSFKGLAFNLAYGLVGLGYSLLIAALRERIPATPASGVSAQDLAFMQSVAYFPWYFLFGLLVVVWVAWVKLDGARDRPHARPWR